MDDALLVDLAKRFWTLAGEEETFPRSLERAISWGLPLTIVKLPRLTLDASRGWLSARQVAFAASEPDRRLRAFLVARAGRGIVFIDGTDPDDERRFSLAHETAHFLIEYWLVRQKVIQVLGEPAREILDGERLPTPAERLAGVLNGVPIGTFSSLLPRDDSGSIQCSTLLAAEDSADRLALELLAPRALLNSCIRRIGINVETANATDGVAKLLINAFGIPARISEAYAAYVLRSRGPSSIRQWLGLAAK